jgi:hypothetical protein
MAEIAAMVLGLIALVAIVTSAVVLHKPAPPPERSALERARDKWIASGDPADEQHWKQLLENTED